MPSFLRIVFLLVLETCFFTAQATDSLVISHLMSRQGLSNNSVRCIFQDSRGFMWFGTYDGLNRYDGYGFKVFRNRLKDSTSLPYNYIYTITEDRDHHIWVGTGRGGAIYNSLTDKFTPISYVPYDGKEPVEVAATINTVATDQQGTVYVGTNGNGLMVRQRGAAAARQVVFRRGKEMLSNLNVTHLLVDRDNTIWLTIGDIGLCYYDPKSRQIRQVDSYFKVIADLAAGDSGRLLVADTKSVWQYNRNNGSRTEIYRLANAGDDKTIVALFADPQQLWIGTEGGGAIVHNRKTGSTTSLLPGADKASTISSANVSAIYQDKEGRKWLGTLKGGIDIIHPVTGPFRTIAKKAQYENSLVNDFVSAFNEDKEGRLWIGTDGGGLSIWDRTTNRFTNYVYQPGRPGSLSSNMITSLLQDAAGNNWVATYGGGINRFSPATNAFVNYRCVDATGTQDNYVWVLYEDRSKTLWATTYVYGKVYRFNKGQNRFEEFDPNLINILSFTQDAAGALWAGNATQFFKIDTVHLQHQVYNIGRPIRAIYEDSHKRLWLGTEGGGLILFDRRTGNIAAQYSDADGLCNNSVLNILEDGRGRLWLSTFNGLSEFDPVHKSFKNYYESDGLQSNQFSYNAALRLRSGEMVFGGISGFSLFHPEKLQFKTSSPPLFLTELRVNNQPVSTGSEYVSEKDSNGIRTLVIPFNEAVLSFDFTALEYTMPDKISYAYYLEGWDKGWNHTGSLRTANYTRLKEGHYRLHIKSTNAAGDWNPAEIGMEIIILPPWYRTWWAYLLYAIGLVGLIYLYLYYKNRQARLQYEVKLAKINAAKETELAEKKLTFFTDVSHEFQTPLMLIINPLKDYLQNDDPRQDKKDLNVVYRNARRLLSLVDQLLQFRKAGAEADTLRIVKLDFSELCRDVFASFENQARLKQLHYQFVSGSESIFLYADREKMEVILYNLLSNAIKFTPDGGEIVMSLTALDNKVEVKFTDNGMGIPPEVGSKLFERFYRVEQASAPSKPGFGIGLYLVKHFVEKHRGEISYDSTPGISTTFRIVFQQGTAHLAGVPVYEDAVVEKPTVTEAAPDMITLPEPEKAGPGELLSSEKSILVVEDNPQIREYITGIFRGSFTLYEASGGHKAIELARTYLPDIIISDIMMDNGNGLDLCNVIKNDPALGHIPVILLTAVADADMRLKGTQCGADDYITKPFEKELLVARVTALLKNRTKLQEYFFNEVTLKKQDFKITAEYKEFLENCMAIVERHLEDDQFNIKKLSQEIGMSHSALYRRVKSISGQSITGFIRFIRLRKAAELMIKTSSNINEIAFQVGMNDVKYFRKQFNALFGMNPSEYIRKYRTAFNQGYTLQDKRELPDK